MFVFDYESANEIDNHLSIDEYLKELEGSAVKWLGLYGLTVTYKKTNTLGSVHYRSHQLCFQQQVVISS